MFLKKINKCWWGLLISEHQENYSFPHKQERLLTSNKLYMTRPRPVYYKKFSATKCFEGGCLLRRTKMWSPVKTQSKTRWVSTRSSLKMFPFTEVTVPSKSDEVTKVMDLAFVDGWVSHATTWRCCCSDTEITTAGGHEAHGGIGSGSSGFGRSRGTHESSSGRLGCTVITVKRSSCGGGCCSFCRWWRQTRGVDASTRCCLDRLKGQLLQSLLTIPKIPTAHTLCEASLCVWVALFTNPAKILALFLI